jgi:hypothetical protein
MQELSFLFLEVQKSIGQTFERKENRREDKYRFLNEEINRKVLIRIDLSCKVCQRPVLEIKIKSSFFSFFYLKLPPYTLAGFDLTIHSYGLLGGRR